MDTSNHRTNHHCRDRLREAVVERILTLAVGEGLATRGYINSERHRTEVFVAG